MTTSYILSRNDLIRLLFDHGHKRSRIRRVHVSTTPRLLPERKVPSSAADVEMAALQIASPGLSGSHSRSSSRPRYSRDRNGNIIEESMFRRPKKLIVCCDGTWMNSDSGWVKEGFFDAGHLQTPSNITRLARSIKPEDCHGHPQIVYYQAGIGTGIGTWDHIAGGGMGAVSYTHLTLPTKRIV